MTPYLAGLATTAGLIVAIGAQNAWVLRLGLMRNHVGLAVVVCILADVTLAMIGIAGLGSMITARPTLLDVISWVGAAYLCVLGIAAFRRAARPDALDAATGSARGWRGVLLGTLAVTLLNPHVYLDTVVLVGSLAATHGSIGRWIFGAGAITASVLWFTALGFGAVRAAPWLARPTTWRMIEASIGVVMFALAAMLVVG